MGFESVIDQAFFSAFGGTQVQKSCFNKNHCNGKRETKYLLTSRFGGQKAESTF